MQDQETSFDEKPKRIPNVEFPEKRKGLPRPFGIDIWTVLLVLILTAVIVLLVLAWLGPAVSNVYTNVIIDI